MCFQEHFQSLVFLNSEGDFMTGTELERAEKRYAQARARLQALKNREAAKERKLDTRRKVILGGALIDLAARDSNASAMLDRLIRNLPREQDRVTFAGWEVKAATTAPAGDAEGDAGAGVGTDVEAGTAAVGNGSAAQAGAISGGPEFGAAVDADLATAETPAPRSPFDVVGLSDEDRRLRQELRRQADELNSRRGPGSRL
ncbi:hypothetical protein ACHFJ0_21785 [Paracoccus sp. NGMCC 1.201697]|uniref:Mobilization protein n=1 Tax=Paracoccus broussonetiae subsp. drimophilus TaxID=3373869 RepID=A0ABW7LRD6_9RHOB